MTKRWVDECWRLVLGIVVTIIAGFITGHGMAYLVGFLLLYAGWMIFRFQELEEWLRDGGKKKQAPDAIGIASEIMQLIYRDKKFITKQKDRLRTSLNQFNDMAAELPDATIVLGDNLQIRWCNAAADELLGINRRRDGGQRIDNLIRLPEFHDFLQQVDPKAEIEIQSPRDPQIMLTMRKVPTDGGLSILTGRDITQRVRLREMRKAFVADVSHELRTPLTVVHGYHEMLLDDESLPKHMRAPLESANNQSSRMATIVDDLLTLSRLESSVLAEEEGNPVAVDDLVLSVITDIQQSTQKANGEVDKAGHVFTRQTDSALLIRGKESEIYSACQNLIGNAVKYTNPGTEIQVNWGRTPTGASLSVIDNGPGFEAEHIPRISERFYRVDKDRSRDKGGTGLGLAIVKYIAQRHGGHLDVRSEPGVGSEFEIKFPTSRIVS